MTENESLFSPAPVVSIDYAGIHARAREVVERYEKTYHSPHGRELAVEHRGLLHRSTVAGMTWRAISNIANAKGVDIHFDTANDVRVALGRPPLRRRELSQHLTP